MDLAEKSARVAELVSFITCCHLFDKLKSTNGAKRKISIVSRFMEKWSSQYGNLNHFDYNTIYPGSGAASFYPLLRLLLPQCDRARPAYGLREFSLAHLYIKVFMIPPKSRHGQSLLHPQPSTTSKGKRNDFADLLAETLHGRCPTQSSLSLKDVNDWLDQLASAQAVETRLHLLQSTASSLTATEHKWVARLIVRRDSCCGLSAPQLLQCLHPAAPGLWDVTQDLYLLCQRLEAIDPKASTTSNLPPVICNESVLFVPFRPMLCERANSVELLCTAAEQLCSLAECDIIPQARLLLETKFDGERVQIHKSQDTYRYWSRNCLEWTESYGRSGTSSTMGSFTPRLHPAFAHHVRECILDGEMMAFDKRTQSIAPKTTGFDVKRSTTSTSKHHDGGSGYHYQPCLIVFDLLYLNGTSLCKRPLFERKQLLAKAFNFETPVNQSGDVTEEAEDQPLCSPPSFVVLEGSVYMSNWCLSPLFVDNVRVVFDQLTNHRQEGLVAKLAVGSSSYLPGRRLHGGWWKLKPDYVSGMLVDLDCLVVGGFYSSPFGSSSSSNSVHPKNKRVRQLFCAVRGDDMEDSGVDVSGLTVPRFLSFCRASSGLTKKQWGVLHAKLAPYWQPYDRRNPNCGMTEWLQVTSERPDVWIAPHYSICLQIHASELMSSRTYAAELTPRFPRVVAVREDKSWRDCLSFVELKRLNEETEGKLFVKLNESPSWESNSMQVANVPDVHTSSSRDEADNATSSFLEYSSISYAGDSGLSTSDIFEHSEFEDDVTPCTSSTPVKLRKFEPTMTLCGRISPISSQPTTKLDSSSSSLQGVEFCLILSADICRAEKSTLERRLRSFGANVVQNPTSSTYCIISDKLTAKTRNLINRSGTENCPHDIVSLSWLNVCLGAGSLCPRRPNDFFASKTATRRQLHRSYDKFGDAFTELSNVTELKEFLLTPNLWKDDPDNLSLFSLGTRQPKCFTEVTLPSRPLFGCVILPLGLCADEKSTTGLVNRLLLIDLERFGAVIFNQSQLNPLTGTNILDHIKQNDTNGTAITHILLLNEDIALLPNDISIHRTTSSFAQSLKWVRRSWATDCIRNRMHLDEIAYLYN